MTRDELIAAINAACDEVERWWEAEFAKLPRYGDSVRTEDVDRLRSEYADRLERAGEPFIAMVEKHDPEFAREFREKRRRDLEGLRRPSKPESWLH